MSLGQHGPQFTHGLEVLLQQPCDFLDVAAADDRPIRQLHLEWRSRRSPPAFVPFGLQQFRRNGSHCDTLYQFASLAYVVPARPFTQWEQMLEDNPPPVGRVAAMFLSQMAFLLNDEKIDFQ
jgi:hypothetical protein